MDPLVIVVAVLAVIVVVNVLLTTAVVRRLAVHERKLASFAQMSAHPGASGLAAGSALPPFSAESVDGRRIDASYLGDGPALIAFFSTTCKACLDHAPEFAALAAESSEAPAFAVVSGAGGAELRRALASVPVVSEPRPRGALVEAFTVDTFPTFYAVEGGHVIAPAGSATEVAELLAVARGT